MLPRHREHRSRRGDGHGFPRRRRREPKLQVPAEGVYGGLALVDGTVWPAAINVGKPPTFRDRAASASLEANLIGFSGDIYGSAISLAFLWRILGPRGIRVARRSNRHGLGEYRGSARCVGGERDGAGMITDEDKDRVRAATDLVELVQETVQLKQRGQEFLGLLPLPWRKDAFFPHYPRYAGLALLRLRRGRRLLHLRDEAREPLVPRGDPLPRRPRGRRDSGHARPLRARDQALAPHRGVRGGRRVLPCPAHARAQRRAPRVLRVARHGQRGLSPLPARLRARARLARRASGAEGLHPAGDGRRQRRRRARPRQPRRPLLRPRDVPHHGTSAAAASASAAA